MDQHGEQPGRDALEVAVPGLLDEGAAPFALPGRIGAGRGVEQRQPGHPVGRLAHDLVGHVSAHGQPGQGEGFRRRLQHRAGHVVEAIVAGEVGDRDLGDVGEGVRLMAPEGRVAEQARQQDQRRPGAHGSAVPRVFRLGAAVPGMGGVSSTNRKGSEPYTKERSLVLSPKVGAPPRPRVRRDANEDKGAD